MIDLIKRGGTAFPIWPQISLYEPSNIKSSVKPWILAASLGVIVLMSTGCPQRPLPGWKTHLVMVGAIISFLGVFIFLSEEGIINEKGILGNLILLVVFFLFTLSQLMTRKIMLSKIPTLVVTTSQMISASVVMSLNLVFFGNLDLPFIASSGTIMTIFYLVFALAIPFFLYNEAMRYIEVGMASLVLVLIIPFGFLFATIFLGEDINMIKSIGAIIVMFGVVLPQISDYFIKRNKLVEGANS